MTESGSRNSFKLGFLLSPLLLFGFASLLYNASLQGIEISFLANILPTLVSISSILLPIVMGMFAFVAVSIFVYSFYKLREEHYIWDEHNDRALTRHLGWMFLGGILLLSPPLLLFMSNFFFVPIAPGVIVSVFTAATLLAFLAIFIALKYKNLSPLAKGEAKWIVFSALLFIAPSLFFLIAPAFLLSISAPVIVSALIASCSLSMLCIFVASKKIDGTQIEPPTHLMLGISALILLAPPIVFFFVPAAVATSTMFIGSIFVATYSIVFFWVYFAPKTIKEGHSNLGDVAFPIVIHHLLFLAPPLVVFWVPAATFSTLPIVLTVSIFVAMYSISISSTFFVYKAIKEQDSTKFSLPIILSSLILMVPPLVFFVVPAATFATSTAFIVSVFVATYLIFAALIGKMLIEIGREKHRHHTLHSPIWGPFCMGLALLSLVPPITFSICLATGIQLTTPVMLATYLSTYLGPPVIAIVAVIVFVVWDISKERENPSSRTPAGDPNVMGNGGGGTKPPLAPQVNTVDTEITWLRAQINGGEQKIFEALSPLFPGNPGAGTLTLDTVKELVQASQNYKSLDDFAIHLVNAAKPKSENTKGLSADSFFANASEDAGLKAKVCQCIRGMMPTQTATPEPPKA